MAKNNSHKTETRDHRLNRFQNGEPYEIIDTLIMSIANYFNNEIRLTVYEDNYQTSLLLLGVHSVALTISEGLFGETGPAGYKLFLEKFVDGDTSDTKFSDIAEDIHKWRNVIAHQWIGSIGHDIGYDYLMNKGWEIRDGITYLNPRIYAEHYLKAFGSGGKIYDWQHLLIGSEKEEAKARLIKKYLEN